MEPQKKKKNKAMFTIFSQQIISGRLLPQLLVDKKIISVVNLN